MVQTDLAGMGDISSRKVRVCLQVQGWVCMDVGEFGHMWAKVGKGGQA